jgi:hypothetical protein
VNVGAKAQSTSKGCVEAVQGSVREPTGLVFADVILRCEFGQGCQEECDVYDGRPGAFGEGEV